MEESRHFLTVAAAATFLLTATCAIAQSAPRARTLKPSERRAPGTQQRKDGAIVHSDYPRAVDQGKKGNMGGIDGGSNAAAHATARTSVPNNAPNKAGTGENPLYEHSGNPGTNPMYEPKDRAKADAGASNSPSGPSHQDASRKHPAGVKYQNRTAAGQQSKKSSTETFKQDFGQVQATKR